jgi:predicted SprT family Zn-dependent metalloprotease
LTSRDRQGAFSRPDRYSVDDQTSSIALHLRKGIRPVQPVDAKQLAWALLQQHGLIGWRFQFDHARRRFGSCRPRAQLITLSKPLTLLNTESEIRDTLLHEIAHALTPGDGHGPRWKAKCIEIGAAPKRCYSESEITAPPRRPAPYQFGCEKCNWWIPRRRRTRGSYLCKHCRGPVKMVMRLQTV